MPPLFSSSLIAQHFWLIEVTKHHLILLQFCVEQFEPEQFAIITSIWDNLQTVIEQWRHCVHVLLGKMEGSTTSQELSFSDYGESAPF
jgi:hypothetical protein